MYPTVFQLPFLPAWLADIKSYGVMMMIAFLSGIWMACRRAMRSQANPDLVLNLGFLALVFGVLGARIMFVAHYWDTRFANQPYPWLAAIDIRSGGLEFWGGPLLAIPAIVIYLRYVTRASVRWYMDICAPSLAWGLAITRIGCFLNGCCWGSACVDEHDPAREKAAVPWAVRFPYGSAAMMQQFQFGQLTIPKELIVSENGQNYVLPKECIDAAVKDQGHTLEVLTKAATAASENLARAKKQHESKESIDSAEIAARKAQLALNGHDRTFVGQAERQARLYGLTPLQLLELSDRFRAKPAHPTQLYEMVSGMLICLFLTMMFYYRERHGIVLGWFLMLYSISRFLLELIRQDNPLDVGGLTISQAISIGTFLAGLAMVVMMYVAFPKYSPRAIPFVLPDEMPEPATASGHKK
jgi:phosphatidylglycerol:prolipoprotein diacylglycerol transferase